MAPGRDWAGSTQTVGAVLAQALHLVFVPDEETLERKRRVEPGPIQLVHEHPVVEARNRYFYVHWVSGRPAATLLTARQRAD
jgi:hypothetical protein